MLHFQNKLNSRGAAALFKLEVMTNVLVVPAFLCAVKKKVLNFPLLNYLSLIICTVKLIKRFQWPVMNMFQHQSAYPLPSFTKLMNCSLLTFLIFVF